MSLRPIKKKHQRARRRDWLGSKMRKTKRINHSHHVSTISPAKRTFQNPFRIYVSIVKWKYKCTAISGSELGNRHCNSLRVAVADADVDRLDARLLGGGGSGTV